MHDPDVPCLSLDPVGQDERTKSGGARTTSGSAKRVAGPDQNAVGGPREFRVGGLRRLCIRMLEGVPHLGWRLNPVPVQDGLSIAQRGGVSERGTGTDHRRIIAGNVGNQQGHDSRRGGMECQPASLHRGQVLPDAVHFVDGRAGPQQRRGDLLLVGQGDTGGRSGQQGARPARNQAEQEIVRTECLGLLQEARGGHLSGLVGNRMGRFDDFDPRAADAVAVRCDRQSAERRVPCLVGRSRHDRRCFASTQNQGASARPAGQMPDDKLLRIGGIDDRVKHLPKRGSMPRVGVAAQRSVYRQGRWPWREPRFAGHVAAPGMKLRQFIVLPFPGSWQAGGDRTRAGSLRPSAPAKSATSARAAAPWSRRGVAIRYRRSTRLRTGPGRDACRLRCRMVCPSCTRSILRGQASSSVPRVDGRPPLWASHARRLAKIHGLHLYRGFSWHTRRCRPCVLDSGDGVSVLSSCRPAAHDRAATMGARGPGGYVVAMPFYADSCRATVGACRLGTTFGILYRQSGGRGGS